MPVTRLSELEVSWQEPPELVRLPSSRDVHLWRFDLDDDKLPGDALSQKEIDRAGRFHFDRDRRRYIRGRGVLRHLIGLYLGVTPTEVQFDYNDNGKPCLGKVHRGCSLSFNLSHSKAEAVCVIASTEVGVDIELADREIDVLPLARRHFYSGEAAVLESLPRGEQDQRFYRYWTCKEAHVKALGLGLGSGARLVDCSILEEEGRFALVGDVSSELRWIPFANEKLIGSIVVGSEVERVCAWGLRP